MTTSNAGAPPGSVSAMPALDRSVTLAPSESGDRHEVRSSYGSVPGGELPAVVYQSILAAYAWVLIAAWLAFGGTGSVDLDLAVGTALAMVFFSIPIILYKSAELRSRVPKLGLDRFLSSRFDTATGSLSGGEAWAQILLIPLVLAIAATLIGGVWVFVA